MEDKYRIVARTFASKKIFYVVQKQKKGKGVWTDCFFMDIGEYFNTPQAALTALQNQLHEDKVIRTFENYHEITETNL